MDNWCFQTQETKVKHVPQMKEYPDIEKFIPYDPLGNVTTWLLDM